MLSWSMRCLAKTGVATAAQLSAGQGEMYESATQPLPAIHLLWARICEFGSGLAETRFQARPAKTATSG